MLQPEAFRGTRKDSVIWSLNDDLGLKAGLKQGLEQGKKQGRKQGGKQGGADSCNVLVKGPDKPLPAPSEEEV